MDDLKIKLAKDKAMCLSFVILDLVRGDEDCFLANSFDKQLGRAITHLLDSDKDIQVYGAAQIEHLWSEVPHVHVKLPVYDAA